MRSKNLRLPKKPFDMSYPSVRDDPSRLLVFHGKKRGIVKF